jgi:CRP-like cAMP-binding protein
MFKLNEEIDESKSFFLNHELIATCPVGSCFGELAVMMNKPRMATARIGQNGAVFATLDKQSYDEIFFNCTTELD